MMPKHIKRLVLAFALFIVLFLAARQLLRPATFGQLGHYRAKAIAENSDRNPNYAGKQLCSTCHDSIRMIKSTGLHASLNCEVCHGPGRKHVLYAALFNGKTLPDSLVLHKPDERKDCAVCHRLNAARIKIQFDTLDHTLVKQVNVMEHNLISLKTKQEKKCVKCHNPHQP